MDVDEDFALALRLQEEELETQNKKEKLSSKNEWRKSNTSNKESGIIDPSWEYIDPTPDIHTLFIQCDQRFFWGKLYQVEVRWSPRMTSCAGVCCYEGKGGLCSIRLSVPLLKLRPRKDLVETLLHEMIHAYLFVTHNNRDRDGHGPEFHKHMNRINKEAGTKITVYHSFHDEVALYQQHWWRCDGPCQKRPPYYGMVKRSMNRAPGPSDFWWKDHETNCGGHYTKIREPAGFSEKSTKQATNKGLKNSVLRKDDIRSFFPFHGSGNTFGDTKTNKGIIKSNDTLGINNKKTGVSNGNTVGLKDLHGGNKPANRSSSVSDIKNLKTSNGNIVGFKDLNNCENSIKTSANKTKNVSDNSATSNVVGFKDLGNGFAKKNTKTGGTPTSSNSTKSGSVSGKAGGKVGGMLANKGGGTLVVTAKGNRTDKSEQVSTSHHIDNTVPFSGKGYTLGGPLAKGEKPVSRLLQLTNQSANESASCSTTTSRTAFKRPASTPYCDMKKSKNDSLVDLTEDSEDECLSDWEVLMNCPICCARVKEVEINSHLDLCVMKDNASGCNMVESGSGSSCNPDKSELDSDIKCPVCNKKMSKCEINTHLESCLGNIFDDAVPSASESNEMPSETATNTNRSSDVYPCPCCSLLLEHSKMNAHLDHCLSGVWDDFNSKI